MKILRKKHKSFVDLLRFSSGFGWDADTKNFTAPNEIWEEYLKVYKFLKELFYMHFVFVLYDNNFVIIVGS